MKERNSKILDLYKSGKTLEEIGKQFSFSRSRAQQVVIKELKADILKRLKLKKLTEDELILLDVAAKEEIQEISMRRRGYEAKKVKERIRKKVKSLSHTKFVTVSSYARAISENSALIKKYFPKIISEIIQRQKQRWSRYYQKCRICGTSSIKHVSHGLCENCYPKSDIFKEMQEASRLRNNDRWKEHLKKYYKEYSQRPEVKDRWIQLHDKRNYGGNREKALKRDGYICQKCGLSREDSINELDRDLYVERINNKGNYEINNLISVCRKCHIKKINKMMRKAS